MESKGSGADHLVVLIHGLWGNPNNLRSLASALRESHGEDALHILISKDNVLNLSYDGIEAGGERTVHEIEKEIKRLGEEGVTIKKFSIVGYSMGGLVARYAIGVLYATGFFDRIEPINFTSFATPHLGVRKPMTGTYAYLYNIIGPNFLSRSGREIFVVDKFRDYGRPLLAVMADPDSIFIHGLAAFRSRVLYSNILNDRTVLFYSADINDTNPFADLRAVTLNPLPGTTNIILDPLDPVRPYRTKVKRTALTRAEESTRYFFRAIPYAVVAGLILPFGLTYFCANACIQSRQTLQRLRHHESGKAGIPHERYRKVPHLLNKMRDAADRLYTHTVTSAPQPPLDSCPSTPESENEAYMHTPPLESLNGDEEKGYMKDNVEIEINEKWGWSSTKKKDKRKAKWARIPLIQEQYDMIKALNDVGFDKFRVHITKVKQTHAAIIVRELWRPGMDEGRVIIKYWADNFII